VTLRHFYCKIFLKKNFPACYYGGMSKILKPLIVIILAVVVAGGAAVYLSRQPDQPAETAAEPSHVDIQGGGHLRGPEKAPVTLVEFGDYQCPSCGAFHPLVKEILNRYPQQVRFEFHHFPLISIHQNTMLASMAAEAAGDQGHYWEMHDALFEHQREWAENPNPEPIFIALATRIGLDMNKFMQGLRSPDLQARILKDVTRGQDAKVDATPTFFVNGERVHVNLSMEDFVRVIDAHLHK
jgi:protein-disulfide isomerase